MTTDRSAGTSRVSPEDAKGESEVVQATSDSSRERPARPSVRSRNAPPVLVKEAPPFSVRFAQLGWALSFIVGGVAIVYFFVVRKELLPVLADVARKLDPERVDATYDQAADIIFWVVFAILVTLLLVQITLLVSFMGRRAGIRWWQMSVLIVQALLYALSLQIVATGEVADVLTPLLYTQCSLALLALLVSTLPGAIAWTVRQHDVRRGDRGAGADF